jgi:hypothetical protein
MISNDDNDMVFTKVMSMLATITTATLLKKQPFIPHKPHAQQP